jgi:hypothetical protein
MAEGDKWSFGSPQLLAACERGNRIGKSTVIPTGAERRETSSCPIKVRRAIAAYFLAWGASSITMSGA